MTTETAGKGVLREIPLNKLAPSPVNVRRTGGDAGMEELAASIAAHGLLQSLSVRPVRDEEGQETGTYEVVAGGRRLAALRLLAKRKLMPKTALVPCLVQAAGEPAELSLAENVVREQLHPADQFEAFRRLHETHGLGAEAIAARFGVTPAVVRQRLRLGAASPVLLARYREGALNLDQLMAFCVTDDHARQEQVWEALSWNKEPALIRRLLTEAHVAARDRRAVFVGVETYKVAGGAVIRDLFAEDGGGWLADVALLDRLVMEKLDEAAREVAGEGWRWVQACPEFPYGHAAGLRRCWPRCRPRGEEDRARLAALREEHERLAVEHEAADELPEGVAARLEAIEAEIDRLSVPAYDPEDVARSGAIVTLDSYGALRIERGFVRPEDEPEAGPEGIDRDAILGEAGEVVAAGELPARDGEEDEPDGPTPLPDRLVAELTAQRTAALREALAADPDTALVALTYALALAAFYPIGHDPGSCLEIESKSAGLRGHAPGIDDAPASRALALRHEQWARQMPCHRAELWTFVNDLDHDSRMDLLAYGVARTVNAVQVAWDRRPRALAHADALAQAVGLDMAVWWAPSVAGYLGRVTKARIMEAVREGVSAEAAERLTGLRKPAMAEEAVRLLAGSRWLPAVLRTPGPVAAASPATSPNDMLGRAAE